MPIVHIYSETEHRLCFNAALNVDHHYVEDIFVSQYQIINWHGIHSLLEMSLIVSDFEYRF